MNEQESWEKEWELLKCSATQVGGMIGFEASKDIIFIKNLITSRDTYWKERVRNGRLSELEILAMHLDRQLFDCTSVSVESVYKYIEQRRQAITNEDNLK